MPLAAASLGIDLPIRPGRLTYSFSCIRHLQGLRCRQSRAPASQLSLRDELQAAWPSLICGPAANRALPSLHPRRQHHCARKKLSTMANIYELLCFPTFPIDYSQTAAAHPAASCGACKAPPPSLIEFKQIHLLKSFLFLRCSLRLDVISDYVR